MQFTVRLQYRGETNESVFRLVNSAVNMTLPAFAAERRAAAPFLLGAGVRRRRSISPNRTALSSIPVTYKLGVIIGRCRHGKAPQYLVDCCTPVTDVVGRQRLRPATQQLMVVPRHRLSTVGRRAFAVHGPMVWNSLPDDLRAQQDYESFTQGLKTWLFSRY